MSRGQTDHSFLADKIALRLSMLPNKKALNVIDAYSGWGSIWNNIQKKHDGKIKITKIDKEQKDDTFVLLGDNRKFLASLPLSKYDIIDLDAYGVPYHQLKILLERKFKGIVFVTFIQSVMGQLPYEFLNDLGYTDTMIKKCQTLFNRNGYKKLLQWLGNNGIDRITIRKDSRKCYLGFNL